MGKNQVVWARGVRETLLKLLGPVCVGCGATDNLEFDCIKPMGHEHHKIGFTWRMSFYRQQHAAGNLQVLCQSCNARKSNKKPAELEAATF